MCNKSKHNKAIWQHLLPLPKVILRYKVVASSTESTRISSATPKSIFLIYLRLHHFNILIYKILAPTYEHKKVKTVLTRSECLFCIQIYFQHQHYFHLGRSDPNKEYLINQYRPNVSLFGVLWFGVTTTSWMKQVFVRLEWRTCHWFE